MPFLGGRGTLLQLSTPGLIEWHPYQRVLADNLTRCESLYFPFALVLVVLFRVSLDGSHRRDGIVNRQPRGVSYNFLHFEEKNALRTRLTFVTKTR